MSRKIKQKWVDGEIFKMWLPDAPPVSPSEYDDEFLDESFNISKWSEFDHGNKLSVSEEKYGLKFDITPHVSTTDDSIAGILQSIPSGDFSITTKCNLSAIRNATAGINSGLMAGILLAENTSNSGKIYFLTLMYPGSQDINYINLYYYTSYSTYGGVYGRQVGNFEITAGYLRVRRTGTTYYFDYSLNGRAFINIYSSSSLAFTPGYFGLGSMYTSSSSVTAHHTIIYDFFRYKNSDVGLSAPVEGNIVKLNL
ncbi:MAG: hypothetical protein ABRQ37_02515 [Candidatus Eremiobacterota bacterium]